MSDEKTVDHGQWDHSSHEQFTQDYAEKSLNKSTLARFSRFCDITEKILQIESEQRKLEVADIGCGAGTQAAIWAKKGHKVRGIDINEPLVELAKQRAEAEELEIEYLVGSATELPWEDGSVDVCLVPELLEHVENWQQVVDDCTRIIRPGGLLILTTSSKLCPMQQEFNLPLYSWYPGFVKRHYERLAVTTRPEIANYATYPAVHWFSFFELESYLGKSRFDCFDRFDLMKLDNKPIWFRATIQLLKGIWPLRWLGHVFTPYTIIAAVKK